MRRTANPLTPVQIRPWSPLPAGMVQKQNAGRPGLRCGFKSHSPLHSPLRFSRPSAALCYNSRPMPRMRGSADSQHSLALDAPQADSPSNNPPTQDPADSGPVYTAITERDLRDDSRLSSLYVQMVQRGLWPNNDAAALEFFAVAEKALHDDKLGTPGKLFASLIRKPRPDFVTTACEDRALRRLSSDDRFMLVRAAQHPQEPAATHTEERQAAVFGKEATQRGQLGYLHAVLVQCFLPQKKLPAAQRHYVCRHGRASLAIYAGITGDPQREGLFRPVPVPWGARARVLLPYIVGYAVRHNTPVVDMGKSLRAFLRAVGLLAPGGVTHRSFIQQVQAVASAQLVLGEWLEKDNSKGVRLHRAQLAEEVNFWMETNERQRAMWRSELTLSDKFFDAIQDHRVPINIAHLVALNRSPRRQDLYTWLAYRTRLIGRGKTVRIALRDLQPLFAPDIADPHLFKHRLKNDLKAIAKVYSGFRVALEKDVLVLAKSRPPVQPKRAHRLIQPVS